MRLGPSLSRLNFVSWMGAEAVRVCYVDETGQLRKLSISREKMIRRVANTLNGSHPSEAGNCDSHDPFDAPIHYLLDFKMGGIDLPYFILLKIAQDILANVPRLIDQKT